jgi:hypothetical protein
MGRPRRVSRESKPVTTIWLTFEKSGEFSRATFYKELTFPCVVNGWMMNIWYACLPLKIRMFPWQICNDKIQSVEWLEKRNWVGPIECMLCGKIWSTEHIFLQCAVASFCWNVVRDALEWPNQLVCMEDLWFKLIEGSNNKNRNFIFLFVCLAWSLWLIRNDLIFNDVIIASLDASVFRAISFMQK